MDDRELEDLLRRYQPAGPPAGLRARILAPETGRRTWPWAAAAAAMFALSVGLHESAARTHATLLRSSQAAARPADAWPALREVATDDEIAVMEMMSALERAGAQPGQVTAWP